MKAFLTVVLLAALSLLAEANMEHLRPPKAVLPVNPRYTAQEWQEIYAAQKLSPEYPPNFKQDTEPQQGYAGKVDVPLDEKDQRIFGGVPAAPGQFPWQVALIIDNMYFCGGSLISKKWVLTAAHCVEGASVIQIILGTNQFQYPGLVLTSTTYIIHPKYNFPQNDIAVIKLPIEVNFTSYIQPIRLRYIGCCLDGKYLNVSGWGRTSDSSPSISSILMYAEVRAISCGECALYYGSVITCSIICTFSTGSGTCNGDSGGPLVYLEKDGKYTQVGIVSFGASASCERYPSGYTRVNNFLCWIAKHTDLKFCFCRRRWGDEE